jgi:hypothetical protein
MSWQVIPQPAPSTELTGAADQRTPGRAKSQTADVTNPVRVSGLVLIKFYVAGTRLHLTQKRTSPDLTHDYYKLKSTE